ncbi:hypothetical protein NMG60_11032893 [Bertholletia excelsa]
MMSGTARKRKSLWDSKDENLLSASERDAWHGKEGYSNLSKDTKWPDLETDVALKSREHPAFLSEGNNDQKNRSRNSNDIPETRRTWDGDQIYPISSGLDGWGQRNHGHSPENSQGQAFRNRRSRSRNRNRSRSRSRSRSRGRGRVRGRSRSRGRGRSRSRSRSRSPLGDYRQESYGWSDSRRSGSGVSSQPCRDFSAGKCRRGSQCRFLHQDSINHVDGGRLEKEPLERGRGRLNFYDGEDGRPRTNKSSMICKDFLKGRCHRGASCKYPHHDSSGYNSERSNRNMPTDHDYKLQQRKNGNVPCKFFMMGKCQRDDCRFSHDCSANEDLDGRDQNRYGSDFDVADKSWNGPKWDEATSVSVSAQSTGWSAAGQEGASANPVTGKGWGHNLDSKNDQWDGPTWDHGSAVPKSANSGGWSNSNVENLNSTDPKVGDKHGDSRVNYSTDTEHRTWSGPIREDRTAEGEENQLRQRETGDHASKTCIAESKDVTRSFEGPEPPVTVQGFPQAMHAISENVHEQNIMRDASGQQLASSLMQSVFPENPQIWQPQNKKEENNTATDDPNSVNMVEICGNSTYPALTPRQNLNKHADSFGFQPSSTGGANQSQQLGYLNSLNGHSNSNGALQKNCLSNFQNRVQVQPGESVDTKLIPGVPQNIMNSEQAMQMNSFPAHLAQIIGNGQLPQLYAALNPPGSKELGPSLPDSAIFPPITSTDVLPDPTVLSQKLYDPIGDSVDLNKSGECAQVPGASSNSIEQKSQVLLEHSSPVSAGLESGKLQDNGCAEDNNPKNPEVKQEKLVTISLPVEDGKLIAGKGKQELENIRGGNVGADNRAGDGAPGKDEKAIRVFKVALVEFVKEILKPKWKEGQMSREVHKTIVKKVVDKVTSTMQGANNIPKTQEKIEQYLSYSKPKLNKLVEAYTERFLKGS